MKQKKKWVIPLCVIGVILLLCAGGLWYMINHSMSFSVGRCLVADNVYVHRWKLTHYHEQPKG